MAQPILQPLNIPGQDWLFNKVTTAERTTLAGQLGLANKYVVVSDTDLDQQYIWDGTMWVLYDPTAGTGGGSLTDIEGGDAYSIYTPVSPIEGGGA
jgi:hypothetical protein